MSHEHAINSTGHTFLLEPDKKENNITQQENMQQKSKNQTTLYKIQLYECVPRTVIKVYIKDRQPQTIEMKRAYEFLINSNTERESPVLNLALS